MVDAIGRLRQLFNGFRGELSGQLRLMKFDARSMAKAFTNVR